METEGIPQEVINEYGEINKKPEAGIAKVVKGAQEMVRGEVC